MLDAAADRYGLPRPLVRAVAWVESRGDLFARSPKGAIGLMQLMPATAAQLGVDPHDPQQNADGGARYLHQLIVRYHGDVARGLAAYVWGLGNVDKHSTWPAPVLDYVSRVNARALAEGGHSVATPFTQAAQPSSSASQPPQSSSHSTRKAGDDDA